jgi:hypothetical protein
MCLYQECQNNQISHQSENDDLDQGRDYAFEERRIRTENGVDKMVVVAEIDEESGSKNESHHIERVQP